MEELENQGRRNNLRVRGIPETVTNEQIPQALQNIFNNILECHEKATINFVHAHRALRARDPDSATPHDIIYCFQRFGLKEVILAKARQNEAITFNHSTILFFQDLSPITLKNRRALHPLLDTLCEKDLKYQWQFPFALTVTHNVDSISCNLQMSFRISCDGSTGLVPGI